MLSLSLSLPVFLCFCCTIQAIVIVYYYLEGFAKVSYRRVSSTVWSQAALGLHLQAPSDFYTLAVTRRWRKSSASTVVVQWCTMMFNVCVCEVSQARAKQILCALHETTEAHAEFWHHCLHINSTLLLLLLPRLQRQTSAQIIHSCSQTHFLVDKCYDKQGSLQETTNAFMNCNEPYKGSVSKKHRSMRHSYKWSHVMNMSSTNRLILRDILSESFNI